MEPVHAQRVCELIAGILLTDGELHASENQLLVRMLRSTGVGAVPESVLAPTLRGEEAVAAIRSLPADVQSETLTLLIEAAVVDGKVVPREQQYLDAVARAMSISAQELEQRITDRLAAS